jgi:hypothetical protein
LPPGALSGSSAPGSGVAPSKNRAMAVSLIVGLLTKIDRDPRFVAADERHMIAIMFFPLVVRLMRIWKGLEKWRADPARLYERQELGASVVWVLRNLHREWLQARLHSNSALFLLYGF